MSEPHSLKRDVLKMIVLLCPVLESKLPLLDIEHKISIDSLFSICLFSSLSLLLFLEFNLFKGRLFLNTVQIDLHP